MNKKSFFIAAFSAFVQYYDYHLFGFLAAKIAKYFLPIDGNVNQLLNTYMIMSLAMIAKPIGALTIGKIGDVYGRSNTFNISLIGTAISSLIVAITPSYDYIGLIAAFTLLITRMVTCALVSSGTDGVRIYIYEHINKDRQCFGIALTSIFTQAGSLTAAISAWFFTLDFMPNYSWRAAFLLGSFMGVVVIILKHRSNITDSVIVKDHLNFDKYKNLSAFKIISKNKLLFLLSTIVAGCIGSSTQFFIIFFGTYNFEILKTINQSKMQLYTALSITIYMVFSIVGGYITDLSNRYTITIVAIIFILVVSFGHIYTLSNDEVSIALFFLTTAALPFLTIPAAAILTESIPVVIRYRIFSLSHAVGSIFISSPTAFIATLLYKKTAIAWLPIIYFMIAMILILISLIGFRKINKAKPV